MTLELRQGPAVDPPPLTPPSQGRVEVWYDTDGSVSGWGRSRGGEHWMYLPGFATFYFRTGSNVVEARAPRSVEPEALADAFRRLVLPMAVQAFGREVLHASAVRTSEGVVAFCARSGSGKSTLAYALHLRGHSVWADDAVQWDLGDEAVVTTALPFTLRLRPASVAYFAGTGASSAASSAQPPATDAERLAALVVLDPDPAPATVIRELEGIDKFNAIFPHAYCFDQRDDARRRRMLERYLGLAAKASVFALEFPRRVEEIPSIVSILEDRLGLEGAGAAGELAEAS